MLARTAHLTPEVVQSLVVPLSKANVPVMRVWNYIGGEVRWLEVAAAVELLDPPDADWVIEGVMLIRQAAADCRAESSRAQ